VRLLFETPARAHYLLREEGGVRGRAITEKGICGKRELDPRRTCSEKCGEKRGGKGRFPKSDGKREADDRGGGRKDFP